MNHDQSDVSPADSYFDVADYDLNPQTWNVESLREMATQRRLPRPRALAWAVLLEALPEPGEHLLLSLQTHRNSYYQLKKELSLDPRAHIDDDPLSQSDESAWKQHFCDNELKAVIRQDVVRTYPDEAFFRDPDVQELMVSVLFTWARAHASVSYRQGMHEVLAPLLLQLAADAEACPSGVCDTLKEYFCEEYREHDSFMLFSAVMRGVVRFYTPGDAAPRAGAPHAPNEVVRYLARLRAELLAPLDAELDAHLTRCNISLELFGIRWLRLLLGREFPRREVPALWGFLFASGPALPRLQHAALALLLTMRDTLLQCSAGAALARLMAPARGRSPLVTRLALHLEQPLLYPAPPPAAPDPPDPRLDDSYTAAACPDDGDAASDGSCGVPEGGDVAAALAALSAVRRALPPAAARLAAALRRDLPRPRAAVVAEMETILRLAALVQCRSHELVAVETALEAAEGAPAAPRPARTRLVPVALVAGRRAPAAAAAAGAAPARARPPVALTVFSEGAGGAADLPRADPARLRTL